MLYRCVTINIEYKWLFWGNWYLHGGKVREGSAWYPNLLRWRCLDGGGQGLGAELQTPQSQMRLKLTCWRSITTAEVSRSGVNKTGGSGRQREGTQDMEHTPCPSTTHSHGSQGSLAAPRFPPRKVWSFAGMERAGNQRSSVGKCL